MKRSIVTILVVVAVLFSSALVVSASTPEDAKALALKALAFYKANGKEKAIAAFNDPKGEFVKGDMYVVIQAFDGIVVANGGNPKLVGMNHLELKDAGGNYFVKEQIEAAKKGGGWVTYQWVNPVTKKVGTKKAWIQRIEGTEMCINCGVFE